MDSAREVCLNPEAMEYFISSIGYHLVEYDIAEKTVTIKAEVGDVIYHWMEKFQLFCIDGIYKSRVGDLL